MAESRHKGIPPPGWTLPPQKYKFLILGEKFGCLKNAANLLLELFPYKAPNEEDVLDSMVRGSKIASHKIKGFTSTFNILDNFDKMFSRAS